MIEIPLTQGQVTIVDDVDADLAELKWHAAFDLSYGGAKSFSARRGVQTERGQRRQLLHRVVLERMIERKLEKGESVDHINHDTLDNRRVNLRLAIAGQNNYNQRIRKTNKSGYKGVSYDPLKRKWRVQIMFNRRNIHIGYFTDLIEAAEAYDTRARELFGDFAFTNFKT